ncbi:MAG TPA: GNAT family N-acetyltransferase [Flavobacterium sp.]|jgi:hypothetical protein
MGWGKTDYHHTEVGDAYAGQGIGKMMVEKAVVFSRENQLKVIPLCPFAKKMFDKYSEFADVL